MSGAVVRALQQRSMAERFVATPSATGRFVLTSATSTLHPLRPRKPLAHTPLLRLVPRPRLNSLARFRTVRRLGTCSDITPNLEPGRPAGGKEPKKRVTGVFLIILLNLGIYAADHLIQFPGSKALYLFHSRPEWYQFITATFCHANWEHLSSNLFFLYIFGKLVEEEEGNLGLWMSYILTGAGANLVSWLVLPREAVSVGASGAVFGLFVISVLVKMSWDWSKILEVLILGQFVIEKIMEAAQASTGLVGSLGRGSSFGYVNHIAHLSGALIGAALVYFVSKIPSQSSDTDLNTMEGSGKKKG